MHPSGAFACGVMSRVVRNGPSTGEAREGLRVNVKARACLKIVGFHNPMRDRSFRDV